MIGVIKIYDINIEVKAPEKEEKETVTEIKQTGLMNDADITLTKRKIHRYTLPKNSKIFAIEFKQKGEIFIGSTEDPLKDGIYYASEAGDIVQLGLTNVPELYIKSRKDLTIIPIIYKY